MITEEIELNPEDLVHTSVQDALCTLKDIEDIEVIQKAIDLELQRGGGRATLLKAFNSRIKKLEKNSFKKETWPVTSIKEKI